MNILTANLKHLYQRRGLWLVYVFIVLLTLPNIMMLKRIPLGRDNMYILLIIFMMLFVGNIFASVQIEVLNKPLSYCLPGHRKINRQFLFLVGIIVSLLYSLPIFLYPGRDFEQLTIMVMSAFFASLTIYCLSVWSSFLSVRANIMVAFFPLTLFAGMFFRLDKVLWDMLVYYPAIFIISGILSSILVWKQLGNDGIARRFCTKPIIGFGSAWDINKMQKLVQARLAEKGDKIFRTAPAVEQFFLGRMMQCKALSIGRYIWGSLYKTLGPALSAGQTILFQIMIFALLMCFMGYMEGYAKSSTSASFMLFFLPCMMTIFVQLPFYSSQLIAGGRKERFYSTMTVIAAIILIVTVVIAMLTALAQPLEKVLPEITLRGQQFSFKAPEIRLLFVPLLIMPISFILNVLIRQKFILFMLTIMIFSMSFPIFMSVGFRAMKTKTPHPVEAWLAAAMNPITIAVLIVLSWFILAVVLYYVCAKRPLAGQGKG
jgi:hypothetical protein